MKRRTLLLIGALLLSLTELSAQFYPRNIVSLRGGLNISSMSQRSDGQAVGKELRNPKIGWHIGAVDEILLTDDMPLYLDVGVMLSNKGVRYVSEVPNYVIKEGNKTYDVIHKSVTQYGVGYLQFPVCVSYHLYFGDFTLQPYAGLHYDVGLWGRYVSSERKRCEQDSSLNSRTKSVESLFEHRTIGRSDFGLMLGVGVTYLERYYLGFSWEDGFCNISKVSGLKLNHHSNFRISVGYNF